MTAPRFALTISLCGVLLVAACNRRVPPPEPPPPPPPAAEPAPAPPPPPPPPPPAPAPAPLTEEELFARNTLEELNAERPLADVFFDFDQFTLRADAQEALQRNAEWLRRWTSTRISIEGHCDQRGTNEYNLALGERRANAVRDFLVSLGVAADRIAVISKGEEEPVCTTSAEACWQQNRRAHFVITAK